MKNNYVPNLKEFSESLSTSRFKILTQMLESKNPTFVLMSILKRADKDLIKESYELVNKFGDIVSSVYSILETNYDYEYRGGKKASNSTGHGSLKKLIGDENAEDLSSGDWMRIGMKIADMKGYNRRDYIGMMNFLATSCFMHEEIKKNLSRELKKHLGKQKVFRAPSRLKGRKDDIDIYAKPTYTDIKKINKKPISAGEFNQYEPESAYQNESAASNLSSIYQLYESAQKLSMINNVDDFYEDDEENVDTKKNNVEGIMQMLAYTLSQLKDVDIADISNDIEDYENGDYEFDEIDNNFVMPFVNLTDSYGNGIIDTTADGFLSETKGYNKSARARLRYERHNGQGGLKGLVDKDSGDDLTNDDLRDIAQKINGMADEDRGEYMSYVGFLGSSCDIFMYIKRGFIQRVKKNGIESEFLDRGRSRKERWQKR